MQMCQLRAERSISAQTHFMLRFSGERQRAVTLVEMLVVISIIAILMSLLLSTLGKAKAEAQKAECANHLKQLSTAIFAYETSHGYFPSGEDHGTSQDPGYSPWLGNNNHCSWDGRIGMWLNSIYPQLDLHNYYNQLNFAVSPQYSDAGNRQEMRRFVPFFHCPSDPIHDALGNGWSRDGENAEPQNAAQILNYFVVSGDSMKSTRPHPDNTSANVDLMCNVSNGMFYNDSKVRSTSCVDGLGYTAMLAETIGRVFPHNAPSATPIPGYPTTERARGMNGRAYVYFDSPPNADDPRISPSANKIALADRGSPNRVRSFHVNGAHVAFAGGSIRFISNFIQSATQANPSPGAWQYMATINAGDYVNPGLLRSN